MTNITIENGRVIHPRVTVQTTSTGINLRAERQLTAIDRIINHHPVSGEMPSMPAINSWWAGSGRNWDRSGYHFLILGDGQIWQLCHLLVPAWGAGAAANGRGIQISIAGNFTPTNSPSRAAQDSYGWLVNQLLNSKQLPNLNHINHVTRHSDWMATSCSGYTTAQARVWIERMQNAGDSLDNIENTSPPIQNKHSLRIGQNVRINQGTRWLDNNGMIPDFVINRDNQIHSMNGNRIVISYNGIVLGAVHPFDIIGKNVFNIVLGSTVRVNNDATNWATGQMIPLWVRGQTYVVTGFRNNNTEVLLASVNSWIKKSNVILV